MAYGAPVRACAPVASVGASGGSILARKRGKAGGAVCLFFEARLFFEERDDLLFAAHHAGQDDRVVGGIGVKRCLGYLFRQIMSTTKSST
jgi:hypothetical protein